MNIMLAEEVVQELWNLDVIPWNKHWAPVFRNFSRQLVREAQLSPGQLVLDIGTGTGIAAFEAAERLHHGFVIGIDRSTKMISAARAHNIKNALGNVFFIQMDGSHTLFPNRLFDRVISNCGISYGTLPQTSREIFRILQDDGRLILNEWHLIDVPPHRTFSEILRSHRTNTPSRKLRSWREALATIERAGNQYRNSKGIVLELRGAGFKRITVQTRLFKIILPNTQAYLRMRFDRVSLRQELIELTPNRRLKLLNELKKGLETYIRNGHFIIKWNVNFTLAAKL